MSRVDVKGISRNRLNLNLRLNRFSVSQCHTVTESLLEENCWLPAGLHFAMASWQIRSWLSNNLRRGRSFFYILVVLSDTISSGVMFGVNTGSAPEKY